MYARATVSPPLDGMRSRRPSPLRQWAAVNILPAATTVPVQRSVPVGDSIAPIDAGSAAPPSPGADDPPMIACVTSPHALREREASPQAVAPNKSSNQRYRIRVPE